VKFLDRREFTYDPVIFHRNETQTALRLHAEMVEKHSANPPPRFFEVERKDAAIDLLWHMPQSPRTTFSRELDIPAINIFERPLWKLTRIGIVPQRSDKFWLANLTLQRLDYFPMRGDLVYWNGYRYMIANVVIPPEAYWHQTNVWMGLVTECIIPPEGDARPIVDPSAAVTAEQSARLGL
jgi:hypothetical protein